MKVTIEISDKELSNLTSVIVSLPKPFIENKLFGRDKK